MDLTYVQTGDCDTCHGTGSVAHDLAGQTYACTYCDGCGVRKRRGYGGYKTPATAARALAQGTGERCRDCDNGQRTYPDTLTCWRCDYGQVVTAALPGMRWHPDVPSALRYQTGRGDVMAGYAYAVNVTVVIQNRPGTWNEAYLGHGAIVSVTDYGRRWDVFADAVAAADGEAAQIAAIDQCKADLAAAVRAEHLTDVQWVKLTAGDTLVSEVVVLLHRNGITVVARDVPARGVLPPTYTADVLNAPIV